MPAKATELDNRHQGDRAACPICRPPDPAKRISASALWARLLAGPVGRRVVVPR